MLTELTEQLPNPSIEPIEDVSDWLSGMLVCYGRPTVEGGIEWSRAHLNEALASTTNDDELAILNAQLDFYEKAAARLRILS